MAVRRCPHHTKCVFRAIWNKNILIFYKFASLSKIAKIPNRWLKFVLIPKIAPVFPLYCRKIEGKIEKKPPKIVVFPQKQYICTVRGK